ncbi:hydroxyacid dehydrogenase [Salinicola endophyticus]|uniref:hydroxyacid dehydrogenase n=1 Tax=Salinicola endophyticus TaxID=1949083 RepID=UPI001FD89CC3|nr:hydroxyacid dehydrogenase [Salinicola endophyticus]
MTQHPALTPLTHATHGHPGHKSVFRLDVWYDVSMQQRYDDRPDIHLTTLPVTSAPEDHAATLQQAHAYQISSAKDETPARWFADERLLAHMPDLLCVSTSGSGYDTVEVEACTRAGVLVMNQAGANARSVAEHTLGLMLGLNKRLAESDHRLRRGGDFSREDLMGRELHGKTLGLVGIGHIGRRVAELARAFGMHVIAHDPLLDAETIGQRGARPVTLPVLLGEADIVSLHCPRQADTLDLFDAQAFAAMKPGALFITTARGGIHSEAALTAALQSGHLAGAGIDVWDVEPPPQEHPLLQMSNVMATYHTAGVTHEARRNIATWAADQLLATLDGQVSPRLLNPEAWPRYAERFQRLLGA